MIGEPFGPWLYQREAEFFSAIRVTVEGYSGEETFDWHYDEVKSNKLCKVRRRLGGLKGAIGGF